MKKINKVLFGLGSITAVIGPVAAVVACEDKGGTSINAEFAKTLVAKHKALFEVVELLDKSQPEGGYKFLANKTSTDLKSAINDLNAELTKISSEIKWDKAKETVNNDAGFKLMKNEFDGFAKALSTEKVNAADEKTLLDLVNSLENFYMGNLTFIVLSYGTTSTDVQEFVTIALEDRDMHGIIVKDAETYKKFVELVVTGTPHGSGVVESASSSSSSTN